MFKLVFSIGCLGLMIISHEASAIQIIPCNKKPSSGQIVSNAIGSFLGAQNNCRNQRDNDEFNRMQEQQQLLREQVRIQQEMLNLQRHQNFYGR
jgi:hypothetical protein